MKNYDEMIARVFERRDEYEKKQRLQRRQLTRAAASLAVVTILGLSAHSMWNSPEIPDDQIIKDLSGQPGYTYGDDTEQSGDGKQSLEVLQLPMTSVTINEGSMTALADMDVRLEEQKMYPTHSWIPGDWKFTGAYTLFSPDFSQPSSTDVQHDGKRYILHDNILTLTTASGNKVTIAMCDFEKPLRDYIIVVDDPKISHIYGIETTILHINDLYNAQFSVNGLHFDIDMKCKESSETGWAELINLLEQIVFYEGYYKNLPDSTDTLIEPVAPEDVPVVFHSYHEAVDPGDLPPEFSTIFCGSYINDVGQYVVVLTEDTMANREAVAGELNVALDEITFETGTYTLAYLTELQAKISQAMVDRELPFVISSAVYEQNNRIGICVNVSNIDQTRLEEDYLSKVYALDTLGGAIEVELISGTPLKDMLETIE